MLDNAVAESFHSTLEFELLSRTRFATHAEARPAVVAWLEEYNTVRFHSTNGMVSPVEFEHGRRRPGAKTYDQLRHRRFHTNTQKSHDEKTEAEAAAPPEARLSRCAMGTGVAQCPGPPLRPQGPLPQSPGATALRAALDPGASTDPGQATATAGHSLPSGARDTT